MSEWADVDYDPDGPYNCVRMLSGNCYLLDDGIVLLMWTYGHRNCGDICEFMPFIGGEI